MNLRMLWSAAALLAVLGCGGGEGSTDTGAVNSPVDGDEATRRAPTCDQARRAARTCVADLETTCAPLARRRGARSW